MEFAYDLRETCGMSSNEVRFGEVVKARRDELDLTQLDVWQSDGPSNTTLTDIENGRAKTLTRRTAQKLDTALRWEPGSAKIAWAGGDPVPLPERRRLTRAEEVDLSGVSPETKDYIRRLEAEVRRLREAQ